MSPFFQSKKKYRVVSDDQAKELQPFFDSLSAPVQVLIFTRVGSSAAHGKFATDLCQDLADIDKRIEITIFADDEKACEEFNVTHFPCLLVSPAKYSIRFTGAPAGEEAQAFLQALTLASNGKSPLSKESRHFIDHLKEKREIKIFVSPTCPYCPGQIINGLKAAVHSPSLVSAEFIETGQHPDLADKYGVGSIPHTVFNETVSAVGLQPEELFMAQLATLLPTEELVPAEKEMPEEEKFYDLVIVGGGPAGLTAGIYARRAGLSAIVLEANIAGGQVALTPFVENYPGFSSIGGTQLVDAVLNQARDYLEVNEGEKVEEIKVGKNLETITAKATYHSKALVFAVGATWKKLEVPGEDKFWGKGVNSCASCDGYLYKGRKVLVIGGGNTALTDALHLKNLGADVTIVHRRDQFKGEQHLQDSVAREKIPVLWDTVLEEIKGDSHVEEALLKNLKSGEQLTEKTDAVFLAIGITPNSRLSKPLGVSLDKNGYVVVDSKGRSSNPRIYAAGDITGGVQQIVTAVGEGATVATAVFEDLKKNE